MAKIFAPIEVQPEPGEEPLPLEIMEKAIVAISKIGEQINKSRLKRRAILILIRDVTGLPLNDIDAVLNALPELEKTFCTKG